MNVKIYARDSDHPIGWADDDGNVYLAFQHKKIASVDRRGNVYDHRPFSGRGKKVGRVDRRGNLYRRDGLGLKKVGKVDHRGKIYKRWWLWRGKWIGRINPFPRREPLQLYALGATLVLLFPTNGA